LRSVLEARAVGRSVPILRLVDVAVLGDCQAPDFFLLKRFLRKAKAGRSFVQKRIRTHSSARRYDKS